MLVTIYDAEPYSRTDTVVTFRCRDEAGKVVRIHLPREQAEPLILDLQLDRLPQLEVARNLSPASSPRMILPS